MGVDEAPKLMLRVSSVFLPALLMDKMPILQCALGIPPSTLYRDPEGRRVVCDLEGEWRVKCYGDLPSDLKTHKADYATLTTDSASSAWGWSADRLADFAAGDWSGKAKSCFEMGLIKAFNCSIELNEDGVVHSIPALFGELLLPFWKGFESDRELEFITLPGERVLLQEIYPPKGRGTSEAEFQVERASQVELLNSTNAIGEPLEAEVFSHLNRASWSLCIPERAEILVLERRYDAFHGLQRARVFIESDLCGWWHSPIQNRTHRWAVDSCHIRLMQHQKGRKVTITIDPPAGVPLFSLSQIRVFALSQ